MNDQDYAEITEDMQVGIQGCISHEEGVCMRLTVVGVSQYCKQSYFNPVCRQGSKHLEHSHIEKQWQLLID